MAKQMKKAATGKLKKKAVKRVRRPAAEPIIRFLAGASYSLAKTIKDHKIRTLEGLRDHMGEVDAHDLERDPRTVKGLELLEVMVLDLDDSDIGCLLLKESAKGQCYLLHVSIPDYSDHESDASLNEVSGPMSAQAALSGLRAQHEANIIATRRAAARALSAVAEFLSVEAPPEDEVLARRIALGAFFCNVPEDPNEAWAAFSTVADSDEDANPEQAWASCPVQEPHAGRGLGAVWADVEALHGNVLRGLRGEL